MNNSIFKIITIIVLILLLGACSMGGGETGTGYKDQTTVGVITGFGSVYINGVRYKTDNTTVLVDDQTSTESFLKVGMVVTLEGSIDANGNLGIANKIHFERDIEGEVIENLMATNHSLNVMGQTVFVDNDTIFESQVATITGFDLIAPLNVVEVSGFSDGSGQIFASRIEVKSEVRPAGTEMEVKGEVKNLSASTFELGNLTIDFSSATYSNLQSSDLANGLLVKVKGTGDVQSGVLLASEIKLKDKIIVKKEVTEGEEVELEGIVTSLVDNSSIYVNGQKVLISETTELENITIALIKIGDRITLEGRLDSDGNIVARELKGKKQSSTQVEGLITKVDATTTTITINGIEIVVPNTTRVKDDSSESDDDERRYFNFSNLGVGDKVQVSFYTDTSSGKNIATRLERERKEISSSSEGDENGGSNEEGSGNDGGSGSGSNGETGEDNVYEWETEGKVTQLDTSTQVFVIEGISINYSRATTVPINLQDDILVEISGVIENGIWYAIEIEVKEED